MRVQGYGVDSGVSASEKLNLTNTSQVTSSTKTTSQEKTVQLSPLMKYTYSQQLTDFSMSSDSTTFGYRSSDGSLGVRLHSKTDVSLQMEEVTIEATFTAESLGLTAEDFAANGGKPLEFSYYQQFMEADMVSNIEAKKVKPKRTMEEILNDLSTAFSKALRNKDGRTSIQLDDEAMQTLMSDPKVSQVMTELLQLIAFINSMKQAESNKNDESINISGTGREYIDMEQTTTLTGKQTNVNMKFTVLPPAEADSSLAGTEASEIEASTGQPPVDLSV